MKTDNIQKNNIFNCWTGSMFYGSNFIDKYPVLFIMITLFDVIFDYIPLFNKWSYNFFMLLKKRN
jgi:hypothetical protein